MIMDIKAYALPNPPTPNKPVIIDDKLCKGCNRCVEVCEMDVFIPNAEKGGLPIILYPDECWYCGNCVAECPIKGAIKINHPLLRRVRWKRKTTGEHFRV